MSFKEEEGWWWTDPGPDPEVHLIILNELPLTLTSASMERRPRIIFLLSLALRGWERKKVFGTNDFLLSL
jgi:hypothetical protein